MRIRKVEGLRTVKINHTQIKALQKCIQQCKEELPWSIKSSDEALMDLNNANPNLSATLFNHEDTSQAKKALKEYIEEFSANERYRQIRKTWHLNMGKFPALFQRHLGSIDANIIQALTIPAETLWDSGCNTDQ